MAHRGGGAKAHARSKQCDHRATSSLVLTTDSRPRDAHEPTGEPESLWGKIDPKSFGDRAYRGRPPELDEKLEKAKKKKKKERDPLAEPPPNLQSKRRRLQEESVLTSTEEGVYQPKTKETRAAYEAMLSVIQQQVGGQPLSIVSGAADEILSVLKNETIKNPDKKKEIEKLLNPIPNHIFDQLVSIDRLITDYQEGGDAPGSATANGDDALDDDVGVAVEFEENEEEEEESGDEVHVDLSILKLVYYAYYGRRSHSAATILDKNNLVRMRRWNWQNYWIAFPPIKKSLEEPSAKINVLLQPYVSQLKVEGLSLTSDMFFIARQNFVLLTIS
ncbi:DExH-box ATP-dependent RNA helicase DExH12-like [Neltuma alba]|uniref:DExH-box ATP-dependent RNA helicase DExH12-like n=1 Tax=Neltuma alba TaxID=207710 RepID=UPI0010A3480B|nr:DExH-box ATP-dependent RNA helicase DExH12-like [Prosopis alba]